MSAGPVQPFHDGGFLELEWAGHAPSVSLALEHQQGAWPVSIEEQTPASSAELDQVGVAVFLVWGAW